MTIEEIKAKYPNSDIWTLEVKSKKGEPIVIHLREMDRVAYKSVSALIAKDELMGVESFLKTLYVGGDDVAKITDDFTALRSAAISILPMLQAEAGELKKN
jgi:hypothetical protein